MIKGKDISYVGQDDSYRAETVIDAQMGLVTESYVIAHLHLDKVETGEMASPEALESYQSSRMDTQNAIRVASQVKQHYTEEEITRRVSKVLERAIMYGATHIRGFVDVDTKAKLVAIRALLKLRRKFSNRLGLQLVAFPQEGIFSDPGSLDLVRQAMEMGADVVGGIPWIEKTKKEQHSHISEIFKIAKESNSPLAMLVDDNGDARSKTLDMLCRETIRFGWEGKVQACHARAMQFYSERDVMRTATLCRTARVGVVSDPHTGPYHTRLDTLSQNGVLVALSQDDCNDAYYPYGRCKMTEVAFISSHILRMLVPTEMDRLYDWITRNPATIIGLQNFNIRPGNRANVVVLRERTIHDALAEQSEPIHVIHDGKLVFSKEQT